MAKPVVNLLTRQPQKGTLSVEAHILARVLARQAGMHHRDHISNALLADVGDQLPTLLEEDTLQLHTWKKYDKAFACEWLNSSCVLVATKCNHLLAVDIDRCIVRDAVLPPLASRPEQGPGPGNPHLGPCGIHGIAMNPAGDMIATGGNHPHDCQVLRVSYSGTGKGLPDFKPVSTLVAHLDWVFGVAWITDRHVVTASRDRTIRLWNVDENTPAMNAMPLRTQVDKKERVRDVKFDANAGRIASILTSGVVQIWDPHLLYIRAVRLHHDKEVVCLAMRDTLVAVGSQRHISFLDVRVRAPVRNAEVLDCNLGVRSLRFQGNLVSSGSGQGRVTFWDLRKEGYLEAAPGLPAARCQCVRESPVEGAAAGPLSHWPQGGRGGGGDIRRPRGGQSSVHGMCALELGSGWLEDNDVFREHFQNSVVSNACYGHAWDPTGTRLLCAGGPLAYGLVGCYVGLWH